MRQTLRGRVSNQTATPDAPAKAQDFLTADEKKMVIGEHPDFPEIVKLRGGFKIKIKVDETDDDGNVTGKKITLYSRGYEDNEDKAQDYKKEEEPFEYYKVPSYVSALRLEGAKLDDSQIQFMNEALKGKDTGPAVANILEVYNDYLKNSAQRRTYTSVLNEKTPLTEDNRDNAYASIVRNFVKTAGVSPENAIAMMKTIPNGPIPQDYTVARFLQNKGKR